MNANCETGNKYVRSEMSGVFFSKDINRKTILLQTHYRRYS